MSQKLSISEQDRIVAVIGPTGAGKSTFIELATGQNRPAVGHGLRSYTAEIQAVRVNHPDDGCPVVFLDTPGFNDTNKSDIDILCMINTWLNENCEKRASLAAIVYLHPISDIWTVRPPLKSLQMFKSLCGQQATSNAILVTTMWSDVREETSILRERELKGDFRDDSMMVGGCRIERFKDTYDSAWHIIGALPKESDIIIPVMGPTGVGKSTFINAIAGRDVALVGHDLDSCTKRIQYFMVPYPGDPTRSVVFVDTPGFNDTYTDDAVILKHISGWLACLYRDGMKLTGIIYLHDISQARFETSCTGLTMFDKLCGTDAFKNIILATTKWADVERDVGQRREEQLSDTYWKEMLAQGSKMARFDNSKESAWAIINPIVKKGLIDNPAPVQKELTDLQSVTKKLRSTLNPIRELRVPR